MRATTPLLSLALLTACLGERGGVAPPPPVTPGAGGVAAAPPTAAPFGASALAGLGPVSALLADRLEAPGPYDPPKESAAFDAGKPHWRTLDLKGAVGELSAMSLFGGGEVIELFPLIRRLEKLAAEEHLQGLVIRFTEVSVDMASAEDLRAALVAFKGSGARKLACHADGPTNATYYVMTACDTIGLQPLGEVLIPGPLAVPLHLRGLLDKIGVVPDFVHVGAFKGAAEPLTRTEPSPEMRETLGAIVDQAYATMKTSIAAGRNLTEETASHHLDTALFTSESAKIAGLADHVLGYEEFRVQQTHGLPWQQVKLKDSSTGASLDRLQAFLGLSPAKRPSEPHIALVYALGQIVDGRGQGTLGARQEIAGRALASAIDNLAADDKVAALVLRVDSPGGSAMASEQIWAALQRAREKKPVIVSMGDLAASGGYYISCGADKIFAQANTLTGSIGVVGGKLAYGDAVAKLGVRAFPIGRGKRAAMWTSLSAWTADERAAILAMMEDVYRTFLSRVAAGRGKTTDEIHAIAQGRVWTGAAAKERGLVDALGGLSDALAEARARAKIGPEVPLEIYPPEPTLKDLLEGFDPSAGLIRAALTPDLLAELRQLFGDAGAELFAAALRQVESFRDAPIQTALLWPVLVR